MATESVNTRRIVVAGLIGNVMEWYDFAVYGYFASVIGHQFFPSDNPAASLIAGPRLCPRKSKAAMRRRVCPAMI